MLAQKISSTEVLCMGRSLSIQFLSETALKTRADAAAEMEERFPPASAVRDHEKPKKIGSKKGVALVQRA